MGRLGGAGAGERGRRRCGAVEGGGDVAGNLASRGAKDDDGVGEVLDLAWEFTKGVIRLHIGQSAGVLALGCGGAAHRKV